MAASGAARAERSAASEAIRRALARELHDRVAQTLTTMLIELENFKVEQTGRQSALRQLDELQVSTRDVLANLRHVLFELRGESGMEDGKPHVLFRVAHHRRDQKRLQRLVPVIDHQPRTGRPLVRHDLESDRLGRAVRR